MRIYLLFSLKPRVLFFCLFLIKNCSFVLKAGRSGELDVSGDLLNLNENEACNCFVSLLNIDKSLLKSLKCDRSKNLHVFIQR
ncbi:hypothetical protein F7725_014265 [Dissostichus mawsoni]|uniref:Uncharacterized protein n=1 Tax=Dissostichus mawsoni TaxID=36200 RepID=A0A7J5YYJ8_DISMA|nr:hypothetical protein F7725_014265 [Dissostichus mawsoni]